MLPVLTLHDNGSVTVTTPEEVHHSPAEFLARSYLWARNYRAYWSEEVAGRRLCSALTVLEDDRRWFVASAFRTHRSHAAWVLRLQRWVVETVSLRGALAQTEARTRQRNHEQQLLACLNRCRGAVVSYTC